MLSITLGINKPRTSAPDDTELIVISSKPPFQTKKQLWLYCYKFQSKQARHLGIAHSKKADVQKFINLPPKTAERMQIIADMDKREPPL